LCNRLLHAFFAHTEEEKSEQWVWLTWLLGVTH
jgi:hypothetical protein